MKKIAFFLFLSIHFTAQSQDDIYIIFDETEYSWINEQLMEHSQNEKSCYAQLWPYSIHKIIYSVDNEIFFGTGREFDEEAILNNTKILFRKSFSLDTLISVNCLRSYSSNQLRDYFRNNELNIWLIDSRYLNCDVTPVIKVYFEYGLDHLEPIIIQNGIREEKLSKFECP